MNQIDYKIQPELLFMLNFQFFIFRDFPQIFRNKIQVTLFI